MGVITNWLDAHMLPCLNKVLFGIDCPGCGFQRSFMALIKGDVGQAWDSYPPIFPVLLTMILLFAALKWDFPSRLTLLKGSYFISVGFIVVNYIIKMT